MPPKTSAADRISSESVRRTARRRPESAAHRCRVRESGTVGPESNNRNPERETDGELASTAL